MPRERACLLGATTTTPSLHTSRFPTTRLVTPSSKMTPRISVHGSVGRGSPVILSHHLLLQIGFAHHDSSIGLVTRSPAKAPTNSRSLGGYGLDPAITTTITFTTPYVPTTCFGDAVPNDGSRPQRHWYWFGYLVLCRGTYHHTPPQLSRTWFLTTALYYQYHHSNNSHHKFISSCHGAGIALVT